MFATERREPAWLVTEIVKKNSSLPLIDNIFQSLQTIVHRNEDFFPAHCGGKGVRGGQFPFRLWRILSKGLGYDFGEFGSVGG